MESEPLISSDVLARYAADAAADVSGVAALGHAVDVAESDGGIALRVHVELAWGRSAVEVGTDVQQRVRDYVESMTSNQVGSVEVLVERVAAPPA